MEPGHRNLHADAAAPRSVVRRVALAGVLASLVLLAAARFVLGTGLPAAPETRDAQFASVAVVPAAWALLVALRGPATPAHIVALALPVAPTAGAWFPRVTRGEWVPLLDDSAVGLAAFLVDNAVRILLLAAFTLTAVHFGRARRRATDATRRRGAASALALVLVVFHAGIFSRIASPALGDAVALGAWTLGAAAALVLLVRPERSHAASGAAAI